MAGPEDTHQEAPPIQGSEQPKIEVTNKQMAAAILGMGATFTGAQTIHSSIFMPKIEGAIDERVEMSIRTYAANDREHLQLSIQPLHVKIEELGKSIERLSGQLDRIERKEKE